MVGYFYKKQNEVVYYFQLRTLNRTLLDENARLNKELAEIHYTDTFTNVLAKLPEIQLQDTGKKIAAIKPEDSLLKRTGPPKIVKYAEYHYIPARVIKNSVSNDQMNFITLNRGAKDGIEKDMAVVTSNGIVGRVAYVSENYSSVVSVLSNRKVSARLTDGTIGFIFWDTRNPSFVKMNKIAITQKIKKGDSIFSTTYSYFPENILIGTVSKIDTIKESNSKELFIKLSTDFRKLQYVYVVQNEMDAERKKLEATTEEVKNKK